MRKQRTMYPDRFAIFDSDRRFDRTIGKRAVVRRCLKLWKCRTSSDRFGLSELEVSRFKRTPISDGDEGSVRSKDT